MHPQKMFDLLKEIVPFSNNQAENDLRRLLSINGWRYNSLSHSQLFVYVENNVLPRPKHHAFYSRANAQSL